MAWRTDSIQGVAFSQPTGALSDALSVWNLLFPDTTPDSFQKPPGQPAGPSTAGGPVAHGRLELTWQLGRIDFLLTRAPGPIEAGPPEIENVPGALLDVAAYINALSEPIAPFRIAIIGNLSQQSSEDKLASVLSREAGSAEFPGGATDCIYQFNVRRKFAADESIEMNRVCTWATGIQQLIAFSIGQNGDLATNPNGPLTIQSIPTVNFKIDVNSATAPGVKFDKGIPYYTEEMANELMNIVKHGREAVK